MSASFDRAAEYFDRTRGTPKAVMDKILRALKEELKGYSHVLDLGVGTGRFSKPLQDAGFEVVGVDLSRKMLNKALEKGTADLVRSDARNLCFRDSAFDATLSIGTLHLVAEWKLVLKEIVRVSVGSLLSVHYSVHGFAMTPNDVYKQLIQEHGYSSGHPGLGEWELKRMIKPRKSKLVASYTRSTEEGIALLNEKVFSYQWSLPEKLHRKAMEKLRSMFSGMEHYTTNVYIYKWTTDDIKDYLGKQTNDNLVSNRLDV